LTVGIMTFDFFEQRCMRVCEGPIKLIHERGRAFERSDGGQRLELVPESESARANANLA
jgi:hypothetical protein